MKKTTTRLAQSEAERRQMRRTAAANAKLFARRPGPPRKKPDGEARSRRVQLLVKPSVFAALQAVATDDGISVNQVCERAFLEYVKNHTSGADT